MGGLNTGRQRPGSPSTRRGSSITRPSSARFAVSGVAVLLVTSPMSLGAQRIPTPGPVASRPADSMPLSGPAPGLLRGEDWLLGALMLGALASSSVEGFERLDGSLSPQTGVGRTWDRGIPRTLGRGEVAGGLAAGTWLVGTLSGSETARRVGGRGVEAMLLSSALTMTLKIGVGRHRPASGIESDEFRPGSFSSSNWSFPSGHTSTVFALATIVSSELGDEAPWVPFVAYPLAAWTGVSRVQDSRHWFTDVVAGAALGVFSGRLVSRLHRDGGDRAAGDGPTPRLVLSSEGDGFGLMVQIAH